MAFKVFLSYRNGPEEQLAVWRLQTLAAAHGIHIFVPPRNGAQAAMPPRLSSDVRKMIDQSDCVLAIMTGPPGKFVQAELTYALTKGTVVIPILPEGIPSPSFLSQLPTFRFSRSNPGKVEAEIIEFLKQQRFSKQNQQAVGALVAIGLGLLVLSAVSEK
jgi:hypothetical protein